MLLCNRYCIVVKIFVLILSTNTLFASSFQDGFVIDILEQTSGSECRGVITIEATGNAGPFSITILDENQNEISGDQIEYVDQEFLETDLWKITNLCVGKYTIYFRNSLECDFSRNFEIGDCPEYKIDEELLEKAIKQPSHCNATDGAIDFRIVNPFKEFPHGFERELINSEGDILMPSSYGYNNLSPGDYEFILSYGSCEYSFDFIIEDQGFIEIEFSSDTPCQDGSSGVIELYVNTDTKSYDVLWENGSTTEVRENLESGEYCVTVTNSNGCKESDCYVLMNTTEQLVIRGITENDCPSNRVNDGSITITVDGSNTGSNSTLTYSWDNGEQSSTITDLVYGEYCVTVTNFCGATGSSCFTVDQDEENPITIDGTVTDGCGGEGKEGQISLLIDGGYNRRGRYDIIWGDSPTNSLRRSNLSAGSYCVTVTDNRGCATNNRCFTVSGENEINVQISAIQHCDDGDCEDAFIEVSTGDNAMYTYFWFSYLPSGGYYQSTSPRRIDDIVEPGEYWVEVSNNICTEIIGVTIEGSCKTVPTVPNYESNEIAEVWPTSIARPQGAILLSSNEFNPSFSYNWTGPNNFVSNEYSLDEANGIGEYFLVVDNGCNDIQKFSYEIENCDEEILLMYRGSRQSCSNEGWGIMLVEVLNRDPNRKYYYFNPQQRNYVEIIFGEIQAPGAENGFIVPLNASNGEYTLTVINDELCSGTLNFELTDTGGETREINFVNFGFTGTPGIFEPISCDYSVYCTSGSNSSRVFVGPGYELQRVVRDIGNQRCSVDLQCGENVNRVFGNIVERSGYQNGGCVEGSFCEVRDVIFSEEFQTLFNQQVLEGVINAPIIRDPFIPIEFIEPIKVSYLGEPNKKCLDFNLISGMCTVEYTCMGERVFTSLEKPNVKKSCRRDEYRTQITTKVYSCCGEEVHREESRIYSPYGGSCGVGLVSDARDLDKSVVDPTYRNWSIGDKEFLKFSKEEIGSIFISQLNGSLDEHSTDMTKTKGKINIYPNPVSQMLNVRINLPNDHDTFWVDVFNLLGVKVYSQKYYSPSSSYSFKISTDNLESGTYTLRTVSLDGSVSIFKKFIKR